MNFLRLDLWWVPVVAVVVVLCARRLMRRRALAITTLSLLTGRDFRASRFRLLPFACVALSLAVVLAALLQPIIPITEREVQQRALDIVLVVDLSLSTTQPLGFKYEPGAPLPLNAPPGAARIDAIRAALKDFISRRPGDRIGMVVFSERAYVVSPLTFDKEFLLGYLNLIDPSSLVGESMTAIGDGVDMALLLLKRQSTTETQNKVVIVFTDGNSNVGRDPIEAVSDADAAGIHVHLVGVDLEEEQKRYPQVGELIAKVRQGGGQYYAASSIADLEAASRGLDQVEKGYLTIKTYPRNEPLVHWFALTALTIFLIAVGLQALPVFIGLH